MRSRSWAVLHNYWDWGRKSRKENGGVPPCQPALIGVKCTGVGNDFAPLAQLDRASVYGTEGCPFESGGV